jgi:hypothetical protein
MASALRAPETRATSRPPLKQDQGGHALNAQAISRGLLVLGIALGQDHPGMEHGRGLVEGRSHGPAGRAPGRPEVHQHGQVAFGDEGLEAGVG